ncbi:MAG: hypothetical protein PHH11_04785, partial [Methylomonas sp.]|nr:hypothetical protein [Methylomonas sp.]
IRIAKDRIVYLTESLRQAEQEVPNVQAGKPLSRDEQLRMLKSKFIHVSSLYTNKHPDALRIKRQIQNLEPGFDGEMTMQDAQTELKAAESELAQLQEKFSATHPDVVKQQQRVAKLEQRVNEGSSPLGAFSADANSGNLAYISLNGQLRATQHELEHLSEVKEALQKNIKEIQANIDKTPLVEKEYLDLDRQRQTSLNKYGELEAKYREAKLAQTLEEEQKGETFTLIEPPIAPEKPEKPNRKKIVALGLGLGLGSGLGITVLLELLHEVVRGAKALERITGMPPITVIPYIETPQDNERRKKRTRLAWMISVFVLIVAVILTHFFVMPLQFIWASAITKLGRL